jgi:hypothetical protein
MALSLTLLAGAKLYFYVPGSTTARATYTDAALGTPHAQPVVADSGGRFPAIYLDPTLEYKCELKTSGGELIESEEKVSAQSGYQLFTLPWQVAVSSRVANISGGIALTRGLMSETLNPRIGAEEATSTTPVDFSYKPEHTVEARRYGVMADGVSDDSAAMQLVFTVAFARKASRIVLPAGVIRIVTPLNPYGNIAYTAAGIEGTSALRFGGPRNEIVIEGESRGSTTLWADNATGIFVPEAVDIDEECQLQCTNIRFRGLSKQGRPVTIDRDNVRAGRFFFDRCIFTEFEYGYCYDDAAGAEDRRGFHHFRDCEFRGNKYGVSLLSDNTVLDWCFIERNDEWGLRIPEDANAFKMLGGKVQYNCEVAAEYDAQIVIQGKTTAMSFDSVYFESKADSNVTAGVGDALVLFEEGPDSEEDVHGLSFRDCYINGAGSSTVAKFATYFIDVEDHNFSIFGITVSGGVLKRFKLDADNQFIRLGASADVHGFNASGHGFDLIYDASENSITPSGDWFNDTVAWSVSSNFRSVNSDFGRSRVHVDKGQLSAGGSYVLISGKVTGSTGATVSSTGGFTVTRNGSGDYSIEIDTTKAQLDSNPPIFVTPEHASGTERRAVVQSVDADSFKVFTFTSGGSAGDSNFSFMALLRKR